MVSPAIPLSVENAFDPLLGRHQTDFFGRQINACSMTDAKLIAIESEAVNAHLHATV
jgi:hypothetical protein